MLQRNGNGNGNGNTKKRNGNGKADPLADIDEGKLVMYKGKCILLTKQQLQQLEQEDKRIAQWFAELSKEGRFSREWILTCLMEVALQCMGKVPHNVGNTHAYGFFPKTANTALKNMAEIQGFNVFNINWKGGITPFDGAVVGQGALPNDGSPKVVELEGDDYEDITAEVAEILSEAGAFKSSVEEATEAEVVQVLPA